MSIKFVVTTRKEVLENLKTEGYYLVGVDGTVPDAAHLYDELYDHHRTGGADIQLFELPPKDTEAYLHQVSKSIAFVTTMVDADAIVSAYYLFRLFQWQYPFYEELTQEEFDFLAAISYDCDHLCVPDQYSKYGDNSSKVVAALKEESNSLVEELGLPSDRRQWSVEQKELFSSKAFEQGIDLVGMAIEHNPNHENYWDYKAIAQPYWDKVEAYTQQILDEDRISEYYGVVVFNACGMRGYVDPRAWYKALTQSGVSFECNICLFKRDIFNGREFKGYSYTLGLVPLHPFNKGIDFTNGVFKALSDAEGSTWGGRATVGGSPWNTSSKLTVEEVISIVKLFV